MEDVLKLLTDGDTKEFVRAVVNHQFEGVEPHQVDEYSYELRYSDRELPGPFKIVLVDEEGGYEGGGEHAERVFAITQDDHALVYYRVTGYYASYSGTEWNEEFTIVAPREVVVIQYFEV